MTKKKQFSEKKIRELVKKFKRVIGCVSDMHVGSPYAIFPDGFSLKSGNVIKLNDGQKQLLDYWEDFKKKCDFWNVDTFLIGGDIVHGQNKKEAGVELISTDLSVQKRAASVLLEPLLKGRKSYWVAGSGYHASTPGHNPDEGLCTELGAKSDIHTDWKGLIANLNIKDTGKMINLSHGGSGAFIYRETAMAREIAFAKMAFANGKLPKIDMFVHGHWHWFAYLHEAKTHYLQLPCWIAFEPCQIYVKNYTRFQPDIGASIIFIDENNFITCWHFLYDLPHIADAPKEI